MKFKGDMNYSLFDERPSEPVTKVWHVDFETELTETDGLIRVGELQRAIQLESVRRIRVDLS